MSGRVQRRQAARYVDRDAQVAAERQQSYDQQAGYGPPPPAAPVDVTQQLKNLADLKNQGILTEEEFAAQKAKILNS
ncbi:MAG TPA: SHOCT domain-containing protein [Nocardioidaceae bacterium]|nr:SHOCT domain-containing protein [Nocardioidaceae bacterium]